LFCGSWWGLGGFYVLRPLHRRLDKARRLIEQAVALGEPSEDPLLSFSVLFGFWVASRSAFNDNVVLELATQFLTLAEKQGATVPLMMGHRQMGASLAYTRNVAQGREHLDRAITLYDAAEHRPLATRFGQDIGVTILFHRSLLQWLLGYPEAALADSKQATSRARESGVDVCTAIYMVYPYLLRELPHSYQTIG
jgi:hypothetical protein